MSEAGVRERGRGNPVSERVSVERDRARELHRRESTGESSLTEVSFGESEGFGVERIELEIEFESAASGRASRV